MTASDLEYLESILDAARELEDIVRLGKSDFDGNRISQRAAERLLEIIGEAAGQLSEDFCARHLEMPIRQAKDTRNFIEHQYDDVVYPIIWDTIVTDIPKLAVQIKAAISD
ncbi:DUF86 domain-containing protein [Candidatus Poriferisocius sp.]|uniref:HepT-like ribonuclease domain-containing protein n=1 Tax=Candidatus Poriferisocius sp. TaxID=3101276 RepID=UPI003B02DE81